MSGGDNDKQAGINQWWDSLVSGVVGKVALMSIVPIAVYVASSVSSFNHAAESRHDELKSELRTLAESVARMNYKQNELVRRVVVIERRVLGYSSLGGGDEGSYLPGGSDDRGAVFEGLFVPGDSPRNAPPREPQDRKQTDPAIQDRERRKLGVDQGAR